MGSVILDAIFRFMNAFAPWSWMVLAVLGMLAYDRWIDDPMVAAAARQGYVTEATKAAVDAELAETKRQWAAAETTAAAWHAELLKAQEAQEKQDAKDAFDTEVYKSQLTASQLACNKFDQRDLDYLGVQKRR